MRIYIRLAAVVLASAALSSCMDVATTGASAVYNHHSLQKNLHDQYLSAQTYRALNYKTKEFQNANISIAAFNDEVLLAGQVPEAWQRQKAEAIVKKIPDIKHIYNLIQVESPSSTLTRISDAWITSKVKSKLIASQDVDATQVKVVTENGTVYLMGVLPPSEADAAIDIARDTDGVTAVVKMFSYLRISKV